MARQGAARTGLASQGVARHGEAWRGTWYGTARRGEAGRGFCTFAVFCPPGGLRAIGCLAAGESLDVDCVRGTWRGLASLGMARSGKARSGKARNVARHGMAGLGLVRPGIFLQKGVMMKTEFLQIRAYQEYPVCAPRDDKVDDDSIWMFSRVDILIKSFQVDENGNLWGDGFMKEIGSFYVATATYTRRTEVDERLFWLMDRTFPNLTGLFDDSGLPFDGVESQTDDGADDKTVHWTESVGLKLDRDPDYSDIHVFYDAEMPPEYVKKGYMLEALRIWEGAYAHSNSFVIMQVCAENDNVQRLNEAKENFRLLGFHDVGEDILIRDCNETIDSFDLSAFAGDDDE